MQAPDREFIGDAPGRRDIASPGDLRHGLDHRLIRIATAALRKARERGLARSYERQDWLLAKAEFEAQESARSGGRLP